MQPTRPGSAYTLTAIMMGLLGLVAIELSSFFRLRYYDFYALDLSMLALAFMLGALLTAVVFRGMLRWARGWRLILVLLPYFVLFALVSGMIYGLLLLLPLGRLPASDDLSMALFYTPIFMIEMLIGAWYVTVPLGVLTLLLLGWRAAAPSYQPYSRAY